MRHPSFLWSTLVVCTFWVAGGSADPAVAGACYDAGVSGDFSMESSDAKRRLAPDQQLTEIDLIRGLGMRPEILERQRDEGEAGGEIGEFDAVTVEQLKARSLWSSRQAFGHDEVPFVGVAAEVGVFPQVAVVFGKAGNYKAVLRDYANPNDMGASDATYGPAEDKRYVGPKRRDAMLEERWALVTSGKLKNVPPNATLFAVASTTGTESLNGRIFMGIRFNRVPGGEPTTIKLFIKLHGVNTFKQQALVGVLGTNAIYGAKHFADNPEAFIRSLTEGTRAQDFSLEAMTVTGDLAPIYKSELVADAIVSQGASHYASSTYTLNENSRGKTIHYMIGPAEAVFPTANEKSIPADAVRARIITLADLSPASLSAGKKARAEAEARGDVAFLATGETPFEALITAARGATPLSMRAQNNLGGPGKVFVSEPGGTAVGVENAARPALVK